MKTCLSQPVRGAFGTAEDWQAMLDRHAPLFSELVPGSAVGFVPRTGSGIQPGKHVAGVVNAGGAGEMLAWVMQADGMRAQLRDYSGFQNAGVDLLLVADEEGLAAMRGAVDGEALTIIKRQIRRGAIMFFVMRTKYELQDAGYEDLLDSLGLAFLGACR
ncbi:MAG TPA: hypothetical protein VKD22_00850 [Ramlibacter sp.]|nr:hypothetical protein [Ramlibacter sp.]